MLSTKLKEAAGNSADATLYVDDVFSTYLYTGNGSTQTITNGIDLAGKGGLVWNKARNVAQGHCLTDTVRGVGRMLYSNDSGVGNYNATAFLSGFNSNGFSLGVDNTQNGLNNTHVSWTFRKAAKFFDVVTYTGTGSARTIAHSLGVAPGMVIVKRTDTTGNWQVYHRSLTSVANSIQLNLTNAQASAPTVWNSTAPTSSVFSVGTDATVNASGGTYVAYLYAHDTSSTGIIQCGSFSGGTNVTVTLGWEPQWLLVKNSTTAQNWFVIDTMRGLNASQGDLALSPNSSSAESTASSNFKITSTGFVNAGLGGGTDTYIYMAIRRPNKPPTSGTQVYQPDRPSSSGTFTIDAGFPIDFSIAKGPNAGDTEYVGQRLTGSYALDTTNANGEYNLGWGFASNTSATIAGTGNYSAWISWNFKRAPGFMDVVCWTGDGALSRDITHSLGTKPNLIIIKSRSGAYLWSVSSFLSSDYATRIMALNSTGADGSSSGGGYSGYLPSTNQFRLSASAVGGVVTSINQNAATYVAYLFATLAGISKVGSYTGNGTSQNIDCGFAAGARFFLVKTTSTTGSWWVLDSARGITAGNDPALRLNSTAAEITTADAVDPYSPGITVNQEATCSINANGVSYIFLAVA